MKGPRHWVLQLLKTEANQFILGSFAQSEEAEGEEILWTAADVRDAIDDEREVSRLPILGQARRVVQCADGVSIDVEPLPDRYNRPIDEALEGARAWWPSDPPATAEVHAIDPDEPSVFLKWLTGPRPEVGQLISFYEPDYLRPLAELWADPSYSSRALEILAAKPGDASTPANGLALPTLRASQRQALGLPRHPVSLLWGPPGTGKTTTIGALVAHEIVSGRSRRIVVLATTHTAVDQAVRFIDCALVGHDARKRVKRFGSRVDPKFYLGCEHLLPVQDKEAFAKLWALIEREPPKNLLEEWSVWKRELDALRARLKVSVRHLLADSVCVGMTVTSALFWFNELGAAELDVIVVDEASQLSGPAARMVALSAKRVLFAGDPQQLSAVVRTKEPRSRKILAETAFDIVKAAPQVFLEEQSRMAPPICAVVSKVFYAGRLVVARKERHDKSWLRERSPYWIGGREQAQIQIRATDGSTTWSKKYKGPIRYGSAEEVLDLIDDILGVNVAPEDILVLTPFRAQRAMLRKLLGTRRVKGIKVSTVHKAQGSERKVVIFDPVDGASAFLAGAEGDRLINVAISRAQAWVVIFLSQTDRTNSTLARIAVLAERFAPAMA